MSKDGKNSTCKKDFYLAIISKLQTTTNLSQIRQELNISKQNLYYYLRKLKEKGYISRKGNGWWEVLDSGKNSTNHSSNLPQDFIRGHAFVWQVNLPKEIRGWDKRIEILTKNNINFNLVGAKLNTPRIKVLGRKIWLCNSYLRIFDKANSSYYGENAIESKKKAFQEVLEIVLAIENKLKISLKPFTIEFKKEHYSLIKNDLAIDHNKKGIILRISDETGEWLLVDDSLEMGGELENVGKSSFTTNLPMQKWWNENKDTKFQVTPKFILTAFEKQAQNVNGLIETQEYLKQNIRTHFEVLRGIKKEIKNLGKTIGGVIRENKELKLETKHQKTLSDY